MREISLNDLCGKGYATYYKKLHDPTIRYIAIKGSRASKKSKTTALFLILLLLEYSETNILVVRRYENTLKDSCYADLKWAIYKLGLENDFKFLQSPREIRRISTEQIIFFRGLDDPYKITSITVSKGCLPYVWLEESTQIESENKFSTLEGSIRGQMSQGVTPKFIFTFNPWSECWIKTRFFDTENENIYALTTTYKINEFLSDADLAWFENLKLNYPKRYAVEGMANWGRADGLIFENVEIKNLDFDKLKHDINLKAWHGLDFGFTDPTAYCGGYYDEENKIIYVLWEWYKVGVTNPEIAKGLKEIGLKNEKVFCDSAEPKSIEELKRLGINAYASLKGADSVRAGIQKLQEYKIIIHDQCENFIISIQNYAWEKNAKGELTGKPDHEFSHIMDAMRYALSTIKRHNKININNLKYMLHHKR